MKKLMMLLMGLMIAGLMISGCGQKQEAAQEGAPAVEQAAPAAPAEGAVAAGENTPAAQQAAPAAPAAPAAQ
jgi:hypothetical protein